MLYSSVIKEIKQNKERRLSGDVIAIPWSLPRLSTVLPGIEQGRYNLVSASPKAGKCLAKDTLVRMYDNSLKKVQDVVVGDQLLSPTGDKPNIVMSLYQGTDDMYKIEQSDGISYTVNSDHILSVKDRYNYKSSVTNINVLDYLKLSSSDQYRLGGYKANDNSISTLDVKFKEKGEYYGFSLSGNRLFCLEDYTVTHNTQIADFLYVYQPVEWILSNVTDITLKVFYFSLEVSKETKIRSAICYKLFQDHRIVISPQKLSSIFEGYILDDKIESIINGPEYTQWFADFEKIVTYYDTIRSPNAIFHLVKSYAEHPENGSYTYKTISWQNEDGTYSPRKVRDRYIAKRPNEYVIVIVDHIGLLQASPGDTLHQTISKYSSEYCLEMRDRWRYIPVVVQQQSADSSRAQFNYRGDTVIDKIRPDSEGLADNKYTARDVDLMVSLFYPRRYNIDKYEEIDLMRIGDSHREFMINLNRNGISNASIQLFFLGANSHFSEMPRPMTEFDYNNYEHLIKSQI